MSAFSLWLSCGKSARASTASTLRRRIGISRGLALVGGGRVEAEEAPLADHAPASSKRLTPT